MQNRFVGVGCFVELLWVLGVGQVEAMVSMFALNEIIEFAPKTGKTNSILTHKSRAQDTLRPAAKGEKRNDLRF
jgi:hypothetical protein